MWMEEKTSTSLLAPVVTGESRLIPIVTIRLLRRKALMEDR